MFDELLKSTELHTAVAEGNVEQVRQLLEEQAEDVNARAWHGETPLMTACSSESVVLLKFAKQAGELTSSLLTKLTTPADLKKLPRINSKELLAKSDKKRAYDDTLPRDNTEIVQLLLENGAEVDALDESRQSALMKAAVAGRTESARLLLQHGADIRVQDREELTALMLAAKLRRLETVELLLEWGADVDYRTPQGETALMAAAEGGRVEIARLMLERGLDVNTANANGSTALLRAARGQHDAMVAFLRENGAKVGFLEAVVLGDLALTESLPTPDRVDITEGWGQPALFWVVKQGRVDAARLLLERGVSANAATPSGQTVLLTAVMRDDIPCARLLLDAGADPNPPVPRRKTPLGWAGQQGYTDMVNLLLERGANPNAASDEDGSTLSGAVMFGNLEAAKRLLEAGADPNGSVGNNSLLTFATVRNEPEMVRLLLKHGANLKQGNGVPAASILARDKPEIAAMLNEITSRDIHVMAKQGRMDDLFAKLDAGTDINATGEIGESLLIAALRGKQIALAHALIERGIDVNAADRYEYTALICSVALEDLSVMRLLLERGANVDTRNQSGQSALLCAALSSKTEMTELLIEADAKVGPVEAAVLGDLPTLRQLLDWGAGVDDQYPGGWTPLMGAAAGGHLEIIETLLGRGANIHAMTEEGESVLYWSVFYRRLEAAHLLLERGADANASGENLRQSRKIAAIAHKNGLNDQRFLEENKRYTMPPLKIAAFHEDTAIAELLLDFGAEIDSQKGIGGQTALASAASAGKVEMARFLLSRGADPDTVDVEKTARALAGKPEKSQEIMALLKEAGR